jgi:hypothetical protein
MGKALAKADRAARGGGRSIALNPGSYPQNVGVTYGNGGGADWFGPGAPMPPQAPKEVANRAFDFPQGYNVINQPRAYEAISFNTLRQFADGYDLLRLVIETRKDQMDRLKWVIQAKDPKQKMTPQVKNKIKTLAKFFRKPDGEHRWKVWLRMLLEDLFVIDAATLHRRRTVGGQLISLDQIDGACIKRILDDDARTPEEPDTAYQLYLKGMPAANYMQSDLMYEPRNPRIHKVYGYSPVEQILMTINIALRRQVFQLKFFTDGNMPQALIGVPDTWTPDQIRVFQEWFDNILSGDLAERRKARFVPSAVGKTYIPTQETELFGAAEEWLARVTCYAFNVPPTPFIKQMNRATADNSSDTAASEGLDPIKSWVKDMMDQILEEDLDAEDFEFVWRGDDELDPVKRQAITSGYLKDGLVTVNEGRVESGREPYDDPMFDRPMFMTSNGFAPMQLDATAQGGGDPNDPDPKKKPGLEEVDGAEGAPKTVSKMLERLIALGDVDELTAYLKTIPGTAPSDEGVDDE